VATLSYGTYAYVTKLPDRSFFMKKVKKMMLSDAEREKLEQIKADKEFDEF